MNWIIFDVLFLILKKDINMLFIVFRLILYLQNSAKWLKVNLFATISYPVREGRKFLPVFVQFKGFIMKQQDNNKIAVKRQVQSRRDTVFLLNDCQFCFKLIRYKYPPILRSFRFGFDKMYPSLYWVLHNPDPLSIGGNSDPVGLHVQLTGAGEKLSFNNSSNLFVAFHTSSDDSHSHT